MNRVVIVGRTWMQHGHLCVGGHDLDRRFRSVRLLDRFGDHWPHDCAFQVGDVWSIRYVEKNSARKPHVEDVFVMEQRRMESVLNLRALILSRSSPWCGDPSALYHGTVRRTPTGAVYVPERGPLPSCSTGYWQPAHDLLPVAARHGTRFEYADGDRRWRIKWVGTQEPPPSIAAGSLVRVSLSRLFGNEDVPSGYYVQISGVI
jgi:hypothetical protein